LKKSKSWEKMLEKVRVYAPQQMEQWEKPAMAYHLRYLARRAITLEDGLTAVKLAHQAISVYKPIVFETPHRTVSTLCAAYLVWILPRSLSRQIKSLALRLKGTMQKRRILQLTSA